MCPGNWNADTVPRLLHHDDDVLARCRHCGALAVGPCARCHSPVCGDCCVLTDGGANVYAICLACDRQGGRGLRSGWVLVLWWLGLPILLLGVVVALTVTLGP